MNINKQAFEFRGVTVQDYLDWCEKHHKPAYKPETKADFFARLDAGKLVKQDGKLLVKKPRKKKKPAIRRGIL